MNYGQSENKRQSEQPFFTAGVGNAPASENSSKNNLDLTNDATSWNVETRHTTERHGELGGRAIQSAEFQPFQTQESLPALGEIVDTEPVRQAAPLPQAEQFSYIPTEIITEGDHISVKTVNQVENELNMLSQTGNIADFYDDIRSMMEVNLENSYHRKLGA